MGVESQEPGPLKVVIVGAGIAGLTAAIAFGKQGHDVVILEKSNFSREAGAAIHVPPNSTAMLNWLGLDPKDFGGTLMEQFHHRDYLGNLRAKNDYAEARRTWQADWYLVHRIDLHNNLKQRALQTATLHMGCKIVSIDAASNRPSVTLDNGEKFEADLLLGADGLHSVTRSEIVKGSPPPFPVGKSSFRWLLATDDLRQLTATRDVVQEPGVFAHWLGNDRRIVAYPCSYNKIYNFGAFLPSAEVGGMVEGWQTVGSRDSLAAGFADFAPEVKDLIALADENLKVWELFDMKALPTWVNGHAALLGDAAHPFQPFMGQGAAMAVEDAVSLAVLLPVGTRPEEIPARLALYDEARRPRVQMILEYTRLSGLDETDITSRRMTPAEMGDAIEFCITHNEVKRSTELLKLAKQ